MKIDSIIVADAAHIIGPHGDLAEQIEYDGVDIYAIVVRNKEVEKQTGLVISDATVYVKKSDVPGPSVSDYLDIDGHTYRVGGIDDYTPAVWQLETNKWAE